MNGAQPAISPRRVLLMCNTMGRGGAEIQVKDYALRLVRRGHRVLVVSMLPFEAFDDELQAGGVEVASLGMTKGTASPTALVELVRLIRRFRPEVIHAHMFAAILAARTARAILESRRLFGERPPAVIGTAHTLFEASRLRYAAYRLTDPFSDLWTCVCREGVERHEREGAVPRGRGLFTSNGIDVKTFRPNPGARQRKRLELGCDDATFVWLAVGSFWTEAKDYSNVLRAFALASKGKSQPTRLVIAGHGTLLDEKKRLAEDLGLGRTVDFLGLRSDVDELMQASDAFVMGSAREAMPLVLLEAGASALPAVVTDVGANADLVLERRFVVPPKNAEALASAMKMLMSLSDADRRDLGARTREHVAGNYDLEVIVSEWERRYGEVLARSSRPAAS
jgi:glycosyltransferase involved in cell wall biosynthesis